MHSKMNQSFIICDNNSLLREAIASQLKKISSILTCCYSEDQLVIYNRKYIDKEPIILISKNVKINQNTIKSMNHLFYEEDWTAKQVVEFVVAQLSGIQKNIRKKSEKYVFDLVCIGSSTGGIPILQNILENLNVKETSIVICQHINANMNEEAISSISKKLGINKRRVVKVEHRTVYEQGKIYILSGGNDYVFKRKYQSVYFEIVENSTAIYHPSYDLLLNSTKELSDLKIAAITLSGLGNDGSKYMNELFKSGTTFIAQTPASAKAPYMPEAAIATGVVNYIYQPEEINNFLKRRVA